MEEEVVRELAVLAGAQEEAEEDLALVALAFWEVHPGAHSALAEELVEIP